MQFTIHFATINTLLSTISSIISSTFTIHFATINTLYSTWTGTSVHYLQYTLLLLIRQKRKDDLEKYVRFTIHFATINTFSCEKLVEITKRFTIHFATINTFQVLKAFSVAFQFTIHFATINTQLISFFHLKIVNLQYTLLLLILKL